jgi:adenylyltransferase/sulfurtransferase
METTSLPFLSPEEHLRYGRHIILPEVGEEGQRRLKAASVLLIGVGGLGSPTALYLAAAGVGRIGICDPDKVDASNLQRQIIHGTEDVDRPKTDSAIDALRHVNPHVEVVPHRERFVAANAMAIASGYEIIIDGTDNFPARYLANDVSVLLGKPNVHGSIFRFEGQASVFAPSRGGPCYRCLFPSPPAPGVMPSCAEAGVIGVLPGLIGLIQATETIKLILDLGDPLIGRLLLVDALAARFREVAIRRDPACPLCGEKPTILGLIDYELFCAGDDLPTISVEEWRDRRAADDAPILLDVREPDEYARDNLGGRLIPLAELERRIGELDPAAEIVVHCKSGGRSARATRLLKERGFRAVRNLVGGIDAWRERIEPRR